MLCCSPPVFVLMKAMAANFDAIHVIRDGRRDRSSPEMFYVLIQVDFHPFSLFFTLLVRHTTVLEVERAANDLLDVMHALLPKKKAP